MDDPKTAYAAKKAEALALAKAIVAELDQEECDDEQIRWGHVGDMSELVGALRHAKHWAGA